MERLGDVSEEVDDVFQCVGTWFTDIVIGKTVPEDLRVVPDGRHDAASRSTITSQIETTRTGWAKINKKEIVRNVTCPLRR